MQMGSVLGAFSPSYILQIDHSYYMSTLRIDSLLKKVKNHIRNCDIMFVNPSKCVEEDERQELKRRRI